MAIEEARAKLGDLVRDAQQHSIATAITRNGKPAAILVPDTSTAPDGTTYAAFTD
jgi:prevent-host-death family protein